MKNNVENYFASLPESNEESNTEAAPFTTIKQSYARDKTISRVNRQLRGCWSDSMSGACNETRFTLIQESAIVFNQYAGDCNNGESVSVITYN